MNNVIDYYNNEFMTILNNNKNKLIEAFTIYYGEEYREFISESINKIVFCWGVTDYFKHIFKKGYNSINKDTYGEDTIKYLDDVKKICELDYSRIFGINNIDYSKYVDYVDISLKNNPKLLAGNFSFLDNENIIKIIYFDMFCSSDKDIIHEINHYLTTRVLGTLNIDNKNILVQKVGLSEYGNEKVFFEELINERSSIDIFNIFKSLDGYLTLNKKISFNNPNKYEKFLPLIESFYSKYNEIVKEVRISEDSNKLFNYIDKEVYEEFVKFIDYIFENNKDKPLLEQYIKFCDLYLNKMDKKNKNL